MKILITLFTLVSLFSVKDQENLTIKATFNGYEEGFYYFTDKEDYSFFFEGQEASSAEKYNLTNNKKYIGKTFNITYKVETTTGEYGEEYYASIIVQLVLEE